MSARRPSVKIYAPSPDTGLLSLLPSPPPSQQQTPNTLNPSPGTGYESLLNAVSTVKFTGGANVGDDITTDMKLGYANDLTKSTLVNPLGHTGLSYCMCEAILAGCDPKQSGALVPASPIKTAPYDVVPAGTTSEMKIANYIAAAVGTPAPLFLTGTAALGKEYTGLGVQTLAAMSLTGSTTTINAVVYQTIDSQREREMPSSLSEED